MRLGGKIYSFVCGLLLHAQPHTFAKRFMKILLTSTSFQDTPGRHHDLLNSHDWEVVTARGPLNEKQMLELVGDFDGFICGDDEITAAVIGQALPKLKWISKYGIGIDKIDDAYATEKSIPIGYTPGVNHTTVAEHTFGLLIALTKKIPYVASEAAAGRWTRITGNEIQGKKLGVVGLGRIGKAIIERAGVFGLKCSAVGNSWDEEFAAKHNVARCPDFEELFREVDIISLNCPATAQTKGMINKSSIESMKDGVFIVNCARGELVNSADLVEGLNSGKVGGYATDVLETEPPPADHPILTAPNTVVTSHIGSRTFESVQRQATMATQNAIQFATGHPALAQVNLKGQAKDNASEKYFVVPMELHKNLVLAAYQHRGYNETESKQGAQFCELASTHGIRSHNAIKALHLDHLFGSAAGGCVPNAEIRKLDSRFPSSEIWDAQLKLGQSVAYDAIDRAIELADQYGIGQVSVDNCFHYLWGGGYVMEAAKKGYIAYTNCTATLAEVVPFKGQKPTMGTNPHSWGFPTQDSIGFPIVIDWATSMIAMGRVQQFKREGKPLPIGAALDASGNPTTDANKAASLLPFGAHKGYGMCLMDELFAALIGGSLPTLRGRSKPDGEKSSANFYFQVIHPEAISAGGFAKGRTQQENLKAVLDNIMDGNENSIWPGEIEAMAAEKTKAAGGLLFTAAEIKSFNEIASECGQPPWDANSFQQVD